MESQSQNPDLGRIVIAILIYHLFYLKTFKPVTHESW